MKAHPFPRCTLFMLLLLTTPAAHAQVQVFEIESMEAADLGTFGGDESVASDVNDAGEVVGWARMSLGIPHGFLYRNGAKQDITGGLGLLPGYATGINNYTEVVGYYSEPDGIYQRDRAFYWHDSAGMMTLNADEEDPPFHARPNAINDQGRIVGFSSDQGGCNSGHHVATQWNTPSYGRQVITCPVGNHETTNAFDVNSAGTVVGLDGYAPGHAWTWNGTRTAVPELEDPDVCMSDALGINESGVVVGAAYLCGSGAYGHAFLWNGSSAAMKLLGELSGGSESIASEVNDLSFVAGYSKASIWSGGFSVVWRDRAFIWHAHFGMKALPILPGTVASSAKCRANALGNRSASSRIIYVVGYCTNAAGKKRAVRWTVVVNKKTIGNTPPVEF